jgi:hypothetical protein
MYGSGFVGTLSLLFLLLAPFDIGTYSINEEAVSGPEFLRRIGILWATSGVTMIGIAYALWKELSWSRPVMMFWWLVTAVMLGVAAIQDGQAVLSSVLSVGAGAAVAAWYLYGRHNVVAYYRSLEASEHRHASDGA